LLKDWLLGLIFIASLAMTVITESEFVPLFLAAGFLNWLVKTPPGDEAKYPREGTTSLLNSLRDAVEKGALPETNGEDNIWNVAMVEAGKRSDREGRTVPIVELYAPDRA